MVRKVHVKPQDFLHLEGCCLPLAFWSARNRQSFLLLTAMTTKSFQYSDNNQSPLSVLDVLSLDSPETVVKQSPCFSKLPPRAGRAVNVSCQQFSTDINSSCEGIMCSLPASKPVLTACPTSPTRPKQHGRFRVRSSLLSRSSSLNDNKV